MIFWALINYVFSKNDLDSDGFFEIGIPFTFYKEYAGLYSNGYAAAGLLWKGLVADVLFIFLLFLLFFYIRRRVRRRKEIHEN